MKFCWPERISQATQSQISGVCQWHPTIDIVTRLYSKQLKLSPLPFVKNIFSGFRRGVPKLSSKMSVQSKALRY